MEKDVIFKGAGVAIATPFYENGNGINYDELARLIDFNLNNGTDAIIIAGTSGESATMTDEEHEEIIKFTVDYVNKRVPVIAGTGSNDTRYAINLSQHADKAGADALLVVTPYYNKCTQKGLIKHFISIADNVNVPIILYDVPSRTGVGITPETYTVLAEHPRIAAVKEASGNISQVAETMSLCGDKLTFYSGNDDQIVPLLSLGAKGVISVLSNVMPQETHDMCQLFFDGKVEEAAKKQIEYFPLIKALFCEVNPIPVKVALRLMGFDMGPLRMPLCEMEDAHLEQLKTAMRKFNLIK